MKVLEASVTQATVSAWLTTIWASVWVYLKHYATYLQSTLVKFLNVPVQVAVYYFLWKTILAQQTGNTHISPAYMLNYYILAFLLRWLFSLRSVTENYEKAIYEGNLVNYLVRPMPFVAFELGRVTSVYLINLVVTLALLIPIHLFLVAPRLSLLSWTGFILMLVFGLVMQYCIYSLIGLASFWVERVFGVVYAFDLVMLLATGLLLPLELFPPPLYQILYNLPFRFFVYTPVLCLQGPITPGWLIEQISIGMAWIAALVILMHLVWKKGLSRFSGYGI